MKGEYVHLKLALEKNLNAEASSGNLMDFHVLTNFLFLSVAFVVSISEN